MTCPIRLYLYIALSLLFCSTICFTTSSKELVDSWYTQALSLGAIDNGAPGPREFYGSSYYGAFVIDPSGYRIEVCVNDYNARFKELQSQ